MTGLSIGLLIIILLLCMVALYSRSYRDNWAQCIGLVSLSLWSAAEVAALWQEPAVAPRAVTLYAGLAAFALGTALKVMHHHPALPKAVSGRQPVGLASQHHNTIT